MALKWGDFPTWFAAVGTVGALALAFVQIARERNTRLRRDAERDRERRRSQATGISVWSAGNDAEHDGQSWLELNNASNEPVYWAVVSFVAVMGAAPHRGEDVRDRDRALASIVPPGRSFLPARRLGGGMGLHFGFEIAFTDRSGRHWLREATGSLREIGEWAVSYYGVSLPAGWYVPTTPRPASLGD